jgi:hypothetical protein
MNAYVYCLYSTKDGVPRHIGRADDRVSYRFKQHITAALEKEPGHLYDWIRDVWRQGHDVGVFTLQEGVSPQDYDMFENYWTSQFAALLNNAGDQTEGTNSPLADQVIAAITAQLNLGRRPAHTTSG